jgi:AcrR family transcriptional regulator
MAARVGLDRQSIVQVAAEVADLRGLENVTLTAVAERLGVRKPSLYNHINGLPELRRELAIWGTNQLRMAISEVAIGKAKQEAILAIAAAYRSFAHQRPGLYQAIVSSPDRNCLELKEAIQNMMAILKTVLAPYNLDEENKTHAVRGLRSLMHGFVSLEAAGWFAVPVDRDSSYKQLVMTFINGIKSQPKTKN